MQIYAQLLAFILSEQMHLKIHLCWSVYELITELQTKICCEYVTFAVNGVFYHGIKQG